MTIQDAIQGLEEIASKYPNCTVRGEIFDLTISAHAGALTFEVAITDEETEKAREFADEFITLSGGSR